MRAQSSNVTLERRLVELRHPGIGIVDPEIDGKRRRRTLANARHEIPDLTRAEDMGAERSEATEIRDRRRQFHRGKAAAERPLNDRIRDPQQSRGFGLIPHRRFSRSNVRQTSSATTQTSPQSFVSPGSRKASPSSTMAG